ncbi:Protein diaphanous, partial [Zootermopsis nevadensis]
LYGCIESLRIALTNNPLSWVQEFGTKGLKQVLSILNECYRNDNRYDRIQSECIRCLKAIMNNTDGIKLMFDHKEALTILARSLDPSKPNVMQQAVQVLAAICLIPPSGHERVLEAITMTGEIKGRERFQPVVQGLMVKSHSSLTVGCLQLINAIVATPDDMEYRLHLRNEIMRAGLIDVLETLENDASGDLTVQVKIFNDHKEEDYYEFVQRFDNVRLELDDINDCFEVIKNLVMDSSAEPYLLSILQHLLFIRDDALIRPAYYKLIEECVSQIVLHRSGCDPDFRAKRRFQIDVQPLIDTLVEKSRVEDERKLVEMSQKLEEAIANRQETEAKLAHAEKKLYELEQLSGKGKVRKYHSCHQFLVISSVFMYPCKPWRSSNRKLCGVCKEWLGLFCILQVGGSQLSPLVPGGPPPPPMPGMGGPPPPPMPGMGGPPPPPMPGMGGPPPPPMPGMGGPPPPPMPGMGGPPPPPMPGMGGPPPPPMPGMGGPPPPPMPGMGGPPPPPMPGMGGPPPPPMPGMGGPPPPPMPGMGGPPPPPLPGMGPPPPPGFAMPAIPKPDVLPYGLKPKKKWEVEGPLKRANWKAILPQKLSEKSFWVKVQEEKLASPDILTGLAQKFSSKPPSKKMDDVVDRAGTMKKVKDLKVLDGKAAQNISILLGGSLKHMSYADVRTCVLRCDDSVITDNVLQQLISYFPPPDQLKKLEEFRSQYSELTEAEQFAVTLADIKRLLPRLKSMSFKLHFIEMVQDIKPDIVAGTAACEEVKASKKFAQILELILLVGNYMNSGSKNGQAFGFEINFLPKLTSTKDIENKLTLLHYLVETIENKFPELLTFNEDLAHVDKAARVSVETIQKTLRQMESSIQNLETDLSNTKQPQGDDDHFSEVMGSQTFAEDARSQYEILDSMFKNMESLYADLSEFYAFDKQKYSLEEFFTDVKTFKDAFLQANRENVKLRETEEKVRRAREAREKAEQERADRAMRKRALVDMNADKTQEGVMDSLLEALQT